MRLAPQLVQKPRRLQLNATRCSWLQLWQRTRRVGEYCFGDGVILLFAGQRGRDGDYQAGEAGRGGICLIDQLLTQADGPVWKFHPAQGWKSVFNKLTGSTLISTGALSVVW